MSNFLGELTPDDKDVIQAAVNEFLKFGYKLIDDNNTLLYIKVQQWLIKRSSKIIQFHLQLTNCVFYIIPLYYFEII